MVAASWGALPTPDAGAAGSRTTTVSLTCTDSTPTVGTPVSCTVEVDDSNSGTKSTPTGSVELAVTAPSNRVGSLVGLDACTLSPQTGRKSSCTARLLPVAGSVSGQATVLRANFTPDGPSPHRASSGTRNLTVGSIATPVVFSPNVAGTSGSGSTTTEARLFIPACASGTGSVFVAMSESSDPPISSFTEKGWERTADQFGVVSYVGAPGADNPTGTFRVRLACSTGSAGSITASNVTWTSPTYTYTITAPAISALRGDAPAGDGTVASPGSAAPLGVSMSVDPESQPFIDTFGIPGPAAAALKARVDEVRQPAGIVSRLGWAALGRMPTRSVFDRWVPQVASRGTFALERELERTPEFVGWFGLATDDVFLDRAYSRTVGRWPTAAERSDTLRRLRTQGVPRVRILAELVETQHHRDRVRTRDDVVAAYLALTPVVPSPTDLAGFEDMSRAIVVRVSVIEEIALSRAPADRWIAAMAVPGARPRF